MMNVKSFAIVVLAVQGVVSARAEPPLSEAGKASVQNDALVSGQLVSAGHLDLGGTWLLSVGAKPSRQVRVPHTWNVDPGDADYRGKAVYTRKIGDVSAQKGRRARLRFEGAYHTADVAVNGKAVGSHVGGYTPFSFDVTEALDFTPGAGNAAQFRA